MGGDERAEGRRRRTLQAACAAADVHPLLCAVAHRTGDLSLLREEFAPDQAQLLVPGRGLGPERRPRRVRWRGAALADHLAAGRPDHRLTPDERRRIFGFLVGAASPTHWEGFLTEELALEGTDPRQPSWHIERRRGAPSAAPSSGPAPRGWRRRTGCARPAWRSRCSRRTATWAAPGSRTCTRAAASTSPTSSTASPSPRPTTGSRASRPSPTCWPTCRRRPRTWSWGSASASGAR